MEDLYMEKLIALFEVCKEKVNREIAEKMKKV